MQRPPMAVFGCLLLAAVACGETDAEDAGKPSPDGAAPSADGGQPDAAPMDAAASDTSMAEPDAGEPQDAGPDAAPDTGADAGADAEAGVPLACPAPLLGTDPLPPPGSREATLKASGFDFVEGPVWVEAEGALYFSDMDFGNQGPDGVAARMHRYVPGVGASVFLPASNSNGLALDVDGSLLAATHDAQTLSRFDPDTGARTTLDLTYMGKHFNSPNDLAVRSDGHVYFTDPDWQLKPRTSETGITGVYHVSPAGEVALVDGSLDRPNGIALSPDERTLYVGSAGNDLRAYAVANDGSVGGGAVLASPGASDGLGVDCAGNVYVTAGGDVIVYDPQGLELGRIEVAEDPSNVAFGGDEGRTLYITARTGLYALGLNLPGRAY